MLVPIIIAFFGILLRILFYYRWEHTLFQYDFEGHLRYIEYFAENFALPNPNYLLEAPQQPLYYVISGILYAIFNKLGFSEYQVLAKITLFSLIYSIIAIIFAYKLLRLLSNKQFIVSTALGFFCFNISNIYISSRINNDGLTVMLAVISLYYITKSYKSQFKKHFTPALIFSYLLILTKIPSALIHIILIALILQIYLKNFPKYLKKKIYIYAVSGLFVVGAIFWRAYVPVENKFNFVNSTSYNGQAIPKVDKKYFFSFNIKPLLKKGQSYIFDDDINGVRYSFPSFQYATMMISDAPYESINKRKNIFPITKVIVILGILFLIGLFFFLINIHKQSFINFMFLIGFIINMFLIIHYLITYPSICNSDFRFYTPTLIILGFLIARGLFHFVNLSKITKLITYTLIPILFISQSAVILIIINVK